MMSRSRRAKMKISRLWILQRCHSSCLKFEDQNCLSRPGYVLAIEDDLVQFWCGNMVTLAAMILCIGYLAYGMDFE